MEITSNQIAELIKTIQTQLSELETFEGYSEEIDFEIEIEMDLLFVANAYVSVDRVINCEVMYVSFNRMTIIDHDAEKDYLTDDQKNEIQSQFNQ